MNNPIKNILIIGDGIAAWCLMYELSLKGHHITQYFDETSFPSTSLRTTSINCLRGTEQGISKLGDYIYDSFTYFEKFIHEHNPDGIYEGIEYQLFNDLSKWEKRYPSYLQVCNDQFLSDITSGYNFYSPNQAYFIDPKKLRAWFHTHTLNLTTKSRKIKSLNSLQDDFDAIFVCTNKDSLNLVGGLNQEVDYYLNHSKPVAGSYFEIPLEKFKHKFSENFNVCFDKYHFIYRRDQNVLQIGSSSINKSESFDVDSQIMSDIFNHIKKHLKIDLPKEAEFTMITGIRHKGYKRLPFWGEIAPNIYGMFGLYKNAFSFAFLGAKELSKDF